MKKVMCFGTFDLLHLGHLNYFQQAKKYGDNLIVIIARDSNTKNGTIFTEQERKELIESLEIVDEVVLGNKENKLKIIKTINPDVICLGYDHLIKEDELKQLFPKIKIIRAKPYQTNNHKSSKLKEKILRI